MNKNIPCKVTLKINVIGRNEIQKKKKKKREKKKCLKMQAK